MTFSRWISDSEKVTVAFLMINNSYPIYAIKTIYNLTDNDLSLINQEVHSNNANILVLKQKGKKK